jgi:bacteriocin-like protein
MSKTTMRNVEASREVPELRDELSEEDLKKVSGGYIGETEKNVSYVALRSEVKDSHDRYA